VTGFPAFVAWAKDQGYEPGLWIDRIDPDADYRPANCRWITARENVLRVGRILHDEDQNRMTALRIRTGQSSPTSPNARSTHSYHHSKARPADVTL